MGSLQQPGRFITFRQSNQGAFPKTLSGSETDVSTSNENLSNEEKYAIRHTPRQEPQGQENLQASNRSSLRDSLPSNRSSLDVSSSSYNTLIIHSAGDEPWTGRNSGEPPLGYLSQNPAYGDPKRGSASPVKNERTFESDVQEIHDIPDDYLSQSSLLKQLAKEVKVPSIGVTPTIDQTEYLKLATGHVSDLRPSPEYSKWSGESPIDERKSKSQPDLANERPPTKGREEIEATGEPAFPTSEMVELLSKENGALKIELNRCWQRISKTEKMEQEILKVHRAHEELVQSCERRERLERAARTKLQSDGRRLQEINRSLREQVDLLSTQMLTRASSVDATGPESLRRELSKREVLIAQLITQNKELVAAKERQEIELAAQRATLQEQRTHIAILDTALTNAQGNVVRLEEECRKKHAYVERAAQLQRALSSLQLASDRREQTERKLRLQLERELERAKEPRLDWDGESVPELKRRLRERDEKIMQLESDCSKCERRYLEEGALRQAAIEAASLPKDAKIAALEKTSQETEKIILEARNEKIRHMDEAHAAQKRVADLESRCKDFESKLAEKDAMIRVLQKHAYDKDVSMLGRSPRHTPHGSLASADIDHVLGSTVSREELVSSVLTGSTGFGSGNSYAGSDSSYMPYKQSLDNQLKEIDSQLDSQLLSKRGLCCFPGFANPVTGKRNVKLTNVTNKLYSESESFLLPSRNENGDILLLEKQGRASQQQRMPDETKSCPSPSSLPRPPRSAHRSGLPRRLGEYNRLPDEQRNKSDGGDSLSSNSSSRRDSPARSLIPSPRKLGEYGRLIESGGSNSSLRKPSPSRMRCNSSGRERDSTSTVSETSATSLPPSSKLGFFGGPRTRRGSSLGRENKASSDGTGKYRIQF